MDNILEEYKEYLIEQGYKEIAPSGAGSTVTQYVTAIEKVCDWENVFPYSLAWKIKEIIEKYGPCGEREEFGNISHKTIINSLRRFAEFLSTINLYKENNETNNSRTWYCVNNLPEIKKCQIINVQEKVKDYLYKIYDYEDQSETIYYISKNETEDPKFKNYISLSPDSALAVKLKYIEVNEEFQINEFKYRLLDKLEI